MGVLVLTLPRSHWVTIGDDIRVMARVSDDGKIKYLIDAPRSLSIQHKKDEGPPPRPR